METKYKILLGFVILAWVVLLTGIGLFISPLDQKTTYSATGEVLVTPDQWEALKETFAQTDVNLADVQTLDSSGNLLVQFTGINVNSNFPYGTITVHKGKAVDSPAQVAECFLTIMGGIFSIALTIGFLAGSDILNYN
jgi:hypothetical protein